MIAYKIDILRELAARGFTSTKLRQDKLMSQSTMQRIRQGKPFGLDTLNMVCLILRCQPSDVFEVVATEEEKIKFF